MVLKPCARPPKQPMVLLYMVLSITEAKDVATCYLGGSMFVLKNTI